MEVRDSIVTLRGTVPSYWAETAALDDAELVPGVQRVEDQFDVFDGIVTLERTVDSLWKKSHAAQVASDVAGVISVGTAILTGSVPNLAARRAALNTAWRTPGVVDVRENLAIAVGDAQGAS